MKKWLLANAIRIIFDNARSISMHRLHSSLYCFRRNIRNSFVIAYEIMNWACIENSRIFLINIIFFLLPVCQHSTDSHSTVEIVTKVQRLSS